jgi:hypothetical protein
MRLNAPTIFFRDGAKTMYLPLRADIKNDVICCRDRGYFSLQELATDLVAGGVSPDEILMLCQDGQEILKTTLAFAKYINLPENMSLR